MMGIMNTKIVVKIFAGRRIGTLVPHYRGNARIAVTSSSTSTVKNKLHIATSSG
jgi:hypothetical protein